MLYPFILTLIAGLTTMLGTIPIFIKIKDQNKIISSSCAFASGVMICISIIDLIPEGIKYLNNKYSSLIVIILSFSFLMLGVILSMILDKTIDKVSNQNNLFKVGILSMRAIILHKIPEGIITFIVSN